jgi:acyl carrier protein
MSQHCGDFEQGLFMEIFERELLDLIVQESGLQLATLKAANGLMSTGVLDSFALVTVITFVEDQIGGEVPPSDLTFENFDSIAGICNYVERARAA